MQNRHARLLGRGGGAKAVMIERMKKTIGRLALGFSAATLLASSAGAQTPQSSAPHNVLIFVADGLRSQVVDATTAPALQAVRDEGVDLANSHSLFPTITTPNASAIATGHRLGDTGDFGNVLYFGTGFAPPYASPIQPLEDDTVLGLLDQRYGGDYLHQRSLLEAAKAKGWNTAAIGKLGPTAIQAVTARDGTGTIVIDDLTNFPGGDGLPLAKDVTAAIKAAGLPAAPPDRGLNSYPGAYNITGMRVPTVVVSPYSKPKAVTDVMHDHTSITRFIEARFGLPALTARDANSAPPMEVFDFQNPPFMTPPTIAATTTVPAAVLSQCGQSMAPTTCQQ